MGEDLKEKGEDDSCKCSRRGFQEERVMGLGGSVLFEGSGDPEAAEHGGSG